MTNDKGDHVIKRWQNIFLRYFPSICCSVLDACRSRATAAHVSRDKRKPPSFCSSNWYTTNNDLVSAKWHPTDVLTTNYHSLCFRLSWRNMMSAAVSPVMRLRFAITTKLACEN